MEIRGKIIQVLPLMSGTSKAGNAWKKQEYVLETQDQYPRKVKFDFFGDRVEQFPLAIGDDVIVSYDLESREFNGRWYTDVRAWKAEKATAEQPGATGGFPAQPAAAAPGGFPAQPAGGFPAPADPMAQSPFPQGNPATDDLPF